MTKPVTEETRRRMSLAKKGRPLTPEHCRAISKSKLGKKRPPFTAEHRAHISEGQYRRNQRMELAQLYRLKTDDELLAEYGPGCIDCSIH
jgi:NUMOD3 motif